MKKKIIAIIVPIIALIGGIIGYVGTKVSKEIISQDDYNYGPVDGREDIICYYGCPNSNRVRKLNVNKKKRRGR